MVDRWLRWLSWASRSWKIARTSTELYAVTVRVMSEHEALAVKSHAMTCYLIPVVFQNFHGTFEVLKLKCVMGVLWLHRRFIGLDQMNHNSIVELQPRDLWIRHLALYLLDAQEFVIKFHGPGSVLHHSGDVVDLFRLDLF